MLKRSFTLIEMLVVIAIISILAAMLSPALHKALGSARAVSCANNLRQIGIWGSQYSDEWNGVIPHNGQYWAYDFRGYNHLSRKAWTFKNPDWEATKKSGTVLHCPQMAVVAPPPYTGDFYWETPSCRTTYGINRFAGGAQYDGCAQKPTRKLLSSKKFWFSDSGGTDADGGSTFSNVCVTYLSSWSGYQCKYVPYPFYYVKQEFHPQRSANFLYGDGRVSPMPGDRYFALTNDEKVRLQGWNWW